MSFEHLKGLICIDVNGQVVSESFFGWKDRDLWHLKSISLYIESMGSHFVSQGC